MVVTIFTITGMSGSQINVQTTLKVVCAFAICLEITSTSFPFGEMNCTKRANTGRRNINKILPVILKTLCASAVLFAFLDCPMDAKSAVMVVPMLSPRRIGIAPVRPITLVTPSGPACEAKFCNTAMVAELLCTTSVITVPSATPRIGISFTFAIRSTKIALPASGFITLPMISIPSNNSPNEKITRPIFFNCSFLQTKFIIKPMKISG